MDLVETSCHENVDRISELPRNLIDYIFKGLPVRDVVRTSILSRKWRYIWASYPKLFFDKNFFYELNYIENDRSIQDEFTKVISNVLLVHSGPILELFLHIPNILADLSPDIDQWMLFLSRNGIKELELENANSQPYILPSCIYSCTSLIDLKVRNFKLKPPYEFEGFRYLINIKLVKVSFSASMSATLKLNAPLLEKFVIINCTGIVHRSIYAPKLRLFGLVESGEVDWFWVASNKQLTSLQIELRMEVKNVDHTINMIQFLKNIPKVGTLWFDGFSLKYLAAANRSDSLLCSLVPLLTKLRLSTFEVGDLDQLSSSLCLLKSCPNLILLEVNVAASKDNITELVTTYLEPTNCTDMNLNKLQTVRIRYMHGLKAELLFIKLLLSRATCLQRMIIELDSASNASNRLMVSTKLLRFPRASSSAEIIYVV